MSSEHSLNSLSEQCQRDIFGIKKTYIEHAYSEWILSVSVASLMINIDLMILINHWYGFYWSRLPVYLLFSHCRNRLSQNVLASPRFVRRSYNRRMSLLKQRRKYWHILAQENCEMEKLIAKFSRLASLGLVTTKDIFVKMSCKIIGHFYVNLDYLERFIE